MTLLHNCNKKSMKQTTFPKENDAIPLGISKEDYDAALKTQRMYDENKVLGNNYEDIVPRMSNMTFEHCEDRKVDEYLNKGKDWNEGFDGKKFSQRDMNSVDDDDPPPYYNFSSRPHSSGDYPRKPTYNSNANDYPRKPTYNSNANDYPRRPTYNGNYYDYHRNPTYAGNINDFPRKPMSNENSRDGYYYDSNDHRRNSNRHNLNNNFFPRSAFNDYFGSNRRDSNDYYDNDNHKPYQRPARTKINLPGKEQRVFKILLLGGTGTGKSTIINTMTNYFLGGTLDNIKIVIPSKFYKVTETEFTNEHSEAKLDDVTKSQTTKCHEYTFNHPINPNYKFIFIDTPGLSDTNGVKQDDQNIQEIINTAISAGSLSAIVIIANGTEARVTPSIKNTLVLLANNLPDELVDRNLILVLTKCAKSSACFSKDAFAKEIANPKHIFYMDNQAFCTNPQVWKHDEDERHTVQFHWDKSIRTIDNLLVSITELSSTSTQAFEQMKSYRNKIKSEIAKVTQDISNIQQVQDSLEAAQKALQKTGDKKNSFSNYTKTETMSIKKFVNVDYYSTVCTLHFKNEIICHQNCGLEFESNHGTDHFRWCSCMGSNYLCIECGCGPSSHYHDNVALSEETQTINTILEDIKAQYDSASQQYQKHSSDANNYQSSLSTLQAAANAKYELIHKLCNDLSKICSRFNFVDELHANIESMKQDSRIIQNTNIRQNAEMEIKRLEKLANDLSSKGRRFNS
ncbi:14445_t:CDS:2 [Acaulospora morrowiae]|uniref:14445_t:CDS:1 n=1 Tax=Acaulospora morrowiae TaxID=94023 RepID=A0A9N8VB55_9GLOM|nr:14445_t:CDS:2 [Acaulospora morrowiae]